MVRIFIQSFNVKFDASRGSSVHLDIEVQAVGVSNVEELRRLVGSQHGSADVMICTRGDLSVAVGDVEAAMLWAGGDPERVDAYVAAFKLGGTPKAAELVHAQVTAEDDNDG